MPDLAPEIEARFHGLRRVIGNTPLLAIDYAYRDFPAGVDEDAARQEILRLHLAEELEEYIVNIVLATRNAAAVDSSLEGQILYGASPRASIGIDRASRARAWLAGRDYVGPEDIQDVARDVLRHRLVLSFEAEADGIGPNSVIGAILDGVGVP